MRRHENSCLMGSSSRSCSWFGCLGCYSCARRLTRMKRYKRERRVWAPPIEEDEDSSGAWEPHRYGSGMTKRRARRSDTDLVVGGRSSTDGELPDIAAGVDSDFSLPQKRMEYSVFAARLGIMIMITVLVALLTILTWHFTTMYTTKSIKSLALGLRTEILQRPVARMWNILNSTVDTTVTHVNLARAIVDRYPMPLSLATQDEVERTIRNISWAVFTSQLAVSALSLVYINGVSQSYERNPTTMDQFFVYSLVVNSSLDGESPTGAPTAGNPLQDVLPSDGSGDKFGWYRQRVDNASGLEAGPTKAIVPYNITQEVDQIFLLGNGDIAWHVTDQGAYDTPFLAAGSPVVHPATGDVVAIVSVKRALSGVSLLMKEITSRYSGIMYLTNADGWLLASSTAAPLLKSNADGPSLIRTEESADKLIRVCAEWLRESYGPALDSLGSVHAENVVLEGKKYFIDTFSLNLTQLPLLGVIVTPESYVMGEVERRGDTTVAILIAISVCFLIVGFLFTLVFTTGVSSEMKLRYQVIDHLDARRRAEKSNTYKSQFLANMSHELRTPMAAVIGLLDILLCDEYMTSEQEAMVSQIRHCSTALLRLLNNILDLSKVESGKFVLEEADFDLRHELEGLVDMFSVQCPDNNIEIVLDLADEVPRLVRGDSARTVQIFANLIANSIKFTSSGHVLVQGGCEPVSGGRIAHFRGRNGSLDGNNAWKRTTGSSLRSEDAFQQTDMLCVWFKVDDTGCGIDPSKWETVFDSFVQADPSTTRTYGGTGLGLFIVRSLVRSMGGEIKIARKDGPGTLLEFHLYFKKSQDSAVPRTFKEDITPTFFSETLQNSRLLFSLQGYTGRRTMGRWMRDCGLPVTEASTWEDTKAELDNMVKDENVPKLQLLVILDISLVPRLSDLDVLDTYIQKGVLIGWLLNHNTTCDSKSILRKRGFIHMANKPVYKFKLVQLLRMLVGCRKDGADLPSNMSSKGFQDGRNSGPGKTGSSFPSTVSSSALEDLLKSNASGAFKNLSDHSSSEERPLIEGQGSHSEDFPMYRPRKYLEPYLSGLCQPRYSPSDGWAADSSRFPETSQDEPTVSLLDLDAVGGPGGETDVRSDGLVMDQLKTLEEDGRLISDTRNAQHGQQRLGESGLDKLEQNNLTHQDDVQSRTVSSEQQGSLLPRDKSPSILDQSTVQDGIGKPNDQLEVAADVPVAKPTRARNGAVSSSSRFGSKDALKGIRILLAEDTPVLQKVATMMLEKWGATVCPVGDGLEAVNALTVEGRKKRELKYSDPSSAPFDVVLMDCQMPKMDGYDATKAIREAEEGTQCHIPIIALTAHAMLSDEAKCLEVGMDAYLTKPIDHKLMMNTITSFAKVKRTSS